MERGKRFLLAGIFNRFLKFSHDLLRWRLGEIAHDNCDKHIRTEPRNHLIDKRRQYRSESPHSYHYSTRQQTGSSAFLSKTLPPQRQHNNGAKCGTEAAHTNATNSKMVLERGIANSAATIATANTAKRDNNTNLRCDTFFLKIPR